MPPPQRRLSPGRQLSDIRPRSYEIVCLLGAGGFGKVYRAIERDGRGFQRTVALKILHDERPSEEVLARFRDEARILGLLRDRAIVSVEPMRQVNGRWSVVMEYVDGATLAAVSRSGAVPPRVVAEIIAECARALHVASTIEGPDGQQLSVIHRDLKPANIQVTASGEVKILDFGIARANYAEREAHTQTGAVSGTPRFVAPERRVGRESPAGDIFSLGVVVGDLLQGVDSSSSSGSPATRTATDVEATPRIQESDARDQLLTLSHAMINPDASKRPTARQVERECARVGREAPGESLRDWAEGRIPSIERESADPDTWVGRRFEGAVPEEVTEVTREGRSWRPWLVLAAAVCIPAAGFLLFPSDDAAHRAAIDFVWTLEDSPSLIPESAVASARASSLDVSTDFWGAPVAVRVSNSAGRLVEVAHFAMEASALDLVFTNGRGQSIPSERGVFVERFELGDAGQIAGTRWFAPDGSTPMRAADGSWGQRHERDALGRLTLQIHLGADGEAARRRDGVVGIRREYADDRFPNAVTIEKFEGFGGLPVVGPDGCGRVERTWDAKGRVASWACFSIDEAAAIPWAPLASDAAWVTAKLSARPEVGDKAGGARLSGLAQASVAAARAARGRSEIRRLQPMPTDLGCHRLEVEQLEARRRTTCIGLDGAPREGIGGWFAAIESLDPDGNVVAIAFEDSGGDPAVDYRGIHRWERQYDASGGLIVDGPRTGIASAAVSFSGGYALERMTRNAEGDVTSRSYFDEAGAPTNNSDGYAVRQNLPDEFGNNTRISWFDLKNKPVAVKGRERIDQVFDAHNRITRQVFLNADGMPAQGGRSAPRIDTEYDDLGRVVASSNRDGDGELTLSNAGYAQRRVTYDALGNRVRVAYFGVGDELVVARRSFAERRMEYDDRGHLVGAAHFDAEGARMADAQGVVEVKHDVDDKGNRLQTVVYGLSGKPTALRGCAIWRYEYDERGRAETHRCLGPLGQPALWQDTFHSRHTQWDVAGRPEEYLNAGFDGQAMDGSDGIARVQFERDDLGNVTAVRLFDAGGDPVRGPEGYASLVQEFDIHGRRVQTSVFDETGSPTTVTGDHGQWSHQVLAYDAAGSLISVEQRGVDPAETPVKTTLGYDAEGREIERAVRGPGGRYAIGADGWALRTLQRDARGRVKRVSYFGLEGKPVQVYDGYAGWEAELDNRGQTTRRTYLNGEGGPVNVGGGCAGWTQSWRGTDRVKRAWFGEDGESVRVLGVAEVQVIRSADGEEMRFLGPDGEAVTEPVEAVSNACGWSVVWPRQGVGL